VTARPTVLVTGGGGRLGRLVVADLRSREVPTISLSRGDVGDHADDVHADLGDRAAVAAALGDRRLDVVVHLAAAVHHDAAIELGARMDATLAALVRDRAPRTVVFASSAAVYGTDTAVALTEDSPTTGGSAYATSKLATEALLRQLSFEMPELAVTVLRIFNVAGPSFPDSLVQRLLTADASRPVGLFPPRSFVRDYVHQADVVRAVRAATKRAAPGFGVFNVGAGVPVTTAALLESLGVRDDAWVEIPGPASTSWCSNTAMVDEFGFTPLAVPTPSWNLPTVG
jgi:nucleoside-diphosphate-sugar epimerase